MASNQLVFNGKSTPAFPKYKAGVTSLHMNTCTVGDKKLSVIPETIKTFKPITALDFGNNEIEVLPKELFELTNLSLLHLYQNKIKEIPPEIGLLTSLGNLQLHGNDIEYLPVEIEKLVNLTNFSVQNTKLPLPPDYNANTPQNTIKFILDNQILPTPPITFSKAFIFKNVQKSNIENKFDEILNLYAEEIELDFINIKSLGKINKSTNIVFFLVTFDSHEDKELVFAMIEKCIKLKINYYILLQTSFIESSPQFFNKSLGMLIENNEELIQSKYKGRTLTFNSYGELKGNIYSALTQHSPELRINRLTLVNIGHFKDVTIDFDANINCLIGENGSGKSTILRSIGLALIGSNHRAITTWIRCYV